jgi:hypothetical protein
MRHNSGGLSPFDVKRNNSYFLTNPAKIRRPAPIVHMHEYELLKNTGVVRKVESIDR